MNQSQANTTVVNNNSLNTTSHFDVPVALYARNDNGTIENYIPAVIDDVCVYNDSLTQSEI